MSCTLQNLNPANLKPQILKTYVCGRPDHSHLLQGPPILGLTLNLEPCPKLIGTIEVGPRCGSVPGGLGECLLVPGRLRRGKLSPHSAHSARDGNLRQVHGVGFRVWSFSYGLLEGRERLSR